jgi:adenylate cyclase
MIPTFGDRTIDMAGDGILAEFSSVLNALKCGLAIQEKAEERNAAALPSRHMKSRTMSFSMKNECTGME